jgi:hypothetical protein
MKRVLLFFFLSFPVILTWGATITVWQGCKTFSTWSDVLNISGSNFLKVKADDVVVFCLTSNGDAKLQVSYGSVWINFAGLESLPVAGDYSMVVTSQTAGWLKQGIHVKGTGYTLTAVNIVINDADYTTNSADLFAWNSLMTSGATRGERSTVSLMAYGGAGWYWSEARDLSVFGSIEINLLQPALEPVIVQLLYGDTSAKRMKIAKGATTCRLALSGAHTSAYSFNIMSEKPQTVAIGSVNLLDKEGKLTGISQVEDGDESATTYYGLDGMRLKQPCQRINIVVTKIQGGRTYARKITK